MRFALTTLAFLAVAACGKGDTDIYDTNTPTSGVATPTGTGTGSGTGSGTGTGTGAGTGTGTGAGTGSGTGTGTGGTASTIELAGDWIDSFAGTHTISDSTWTMGSGTGASNFHISQFDNAGDYAIAQNDAGNGWNPNLWSRFDWHIDAISGVVSFCQTAYDAATENDALNTAAADSNDLASGCGGFSWSTLTAAP